MPTAGVANAPTIQGEAARGAPAGYEQVRAGRNILAQARMAAGLAVRPAGVAGDVPANPDAGTPAVEATAAEAHAVSASAPRIRWLELKGCRVGGHVLPVILLHPRYGIAIGGGPADAPALVRQRLERARFSAIFPGTLPILRLPASHGPAEAAFVGAGPVALPGGEAWVSMARQALETEASQALPVRVGIRVRRRRQRTRLLLAGGVAFLLFGATGLGLALLTPESSPGPVLATRSMPEAKPGADLASPPPPASPPSVAALVVPPAEPPDLATGRTLVVPGIAAPGTPALVPSPSPPFGLPAPPQPPVPEAARPGPPVVAQPVPLPPATLAPPQAASPLQPDVPQAPPRQAESRQAGIFPAPLPAPSPPVQATPQLREPETTTLATRRPSAALQEARNQPAPISMQSTAGAQRCRLITQRIQIGETVADADIRFLQRGCPD